MNARRSIALSVCIGLLFSAVLGLVVARTPDEEINVSVSPDRQGRPQVAVDRLNGDRLVVVADDAGAGSGGKAWSSENGGQSFTASDLPLTFDGHTFSGARAPSIAVDREGSWYAAYVVYDGDGSGNEVDASVVVARSDDGLTWQESGILEDNRGAGASPSVETPHLAIDLSPSGCSSYSDAIRVAWVRDTGGDRAVWTRESRNGGSSWYGAYRVSDGNSGAEVVVRPRVAFGPDGTHYIAWLDDVKKTIEVEVNAGSGNAVDVTAASVSLGCGTGACGIDLGCAGSALHGSTPEVVVDRSWGDERGTVYVAFADEVVPADGLDVFAVSSNDGGASWSSPSRINGDPSNAQYGVSLAVHPIDGELHASWYDRRDDMVNPTCREAHVYHAVSSDGISWSEETPVSGQPSLFDAAAPGGGHVGLTAGSETVYPVWADARSGEEEIFLVRIAAANGTLVPGGVLDTDTTWDASSSPFLVLGDVTVDTGATLTIDAGTEVRLPTCDDLRSGLDTNRVEIIVEGVLDVAGSSGSEVSFHSAAAPAAAGDWYGVRLLNTPESSDTSLRHATLSHGRYGVRINRSSPLLEDVVISDVSLQGLEGSARDGRALSPRRLTVERAGSTGIDVSDVFGTWTDVTIRDGSAAGAVIDGNSSDLRLVGFDVTGNAGPGLTADSNGGGIEIILGTFTGNGGTGLTVNGNGPRTLVANDVEANTGNELVVDNDSSSWPNVAVHANDLDAAGDGYALQLGAGSRSADARGNFWGDASGEVGTYPGNVSRIYDIHDDASLRHVDYRLAAGGPIANDGDLVTYLQLPASTSSRDLVITGGAVARNGIDRVEVSIDGGPWQLAEVEGAAFRLVWNPDPGLREVRARVCDAQGCGAEDVETVEITSGTGPTVSGRLQGDETWTSTPGSPIVLTGDVIVPTDTTLTIAPGTEIRAHFLSDDRHGGKDASRIELIVEGTLVVDGDAGSVVSIDTLRDAAPQKGDWYGIRYLDSTPDDDSRVEFAEIFHGVNGIELESAAPDITDTSSSFHSEDGLTGSTGALSKAVWRLNRNVFSDNDDAGADVRGSTEIEALEITASDNGGNGIRFDADPNVVTVANATITGNGVHGLYVNSGGSGFRMSESVVSGNQQRGVFVDRGGTNIRLEKLTVENNGEAGVFVSQGTELVLLRSTITGNQRGLDVGSPRIVGAYNTITGNTGQDLTAGVGIQYSASSGTPAVLGMSDIDNAGLDEGSEIEITNARALSLRRNWWGPDTTADMNAAGYPADLFQILDAEEDPARGRVDYDSWADAPVAALGAADRAAHITWPTDGESLNTQGLVVTGVAYAAEGIDRVEICVREVSELHCDDPDPTAPSWGVADGFESWSFTWFPDASATYELEARVVDDLQQASAPDEVLTVTIDRSAPTATWTGPVTETSTWGGPGVEIVLTGDVLVEEGVTLTVLEGTTFRAQALSDDRLGGRDPSRVELIVRGNLAFAGLAGSEILATSTRAPVERRDWYGLRFEETSPSAGNVLRHATIEGGWYGVEFDRSFATIDGLTVRESHSHGIYVSNPRDPAPSTLSLTNVESSFNGGSGFWSGTGSRSFEATSSSFSDNDGEGLRWNRCDSGASLVIEEGAIERNGKRGLYTGEFCRAAFKLLRSTVAGNGQVGVYRYWGGATIRASTFANHASSHALQISRGGDVLVSKSTFSNNQRNVSASISGGAALTMLFNDFGTWTSGNSKSLTISASSPSVLHFNNFREFAGQSGEIILSNTGAGANATVNFWDPVTTAEMDANPFPSDIASIEDVEENPSWGRVDWRDHRSAEVDLTPERVCGFTNPVDGDALTGTTFLLKGAAAADEGLLRVDVAIDDTANWLPASGTDLFEYEWTPPSSGSYTLFCRAVDANGVEQITPASIVVDVNAANITTSGTLSGDETWSGVITLTGDVTVPSGITLTIEEGTQVRAIPASDDQFGGTDSSRIELIVEGRLDLQGTASQPVTFTSDRSLPDEPQAGDWYGIRFLDTAEPVAVEHAVIEAGVTGISSTYDTHQDVRFVTIRDMTNRGIDMEWGDGDLDVSVDEGIEIVDNVIEDVGGIGVRLVSGCYSPMSAWEQSIARVERNMILRAEKTGIRSGGGRGSLHSVSENSVRDSATSFSNRDGIQIDGCESADRYDERRVQGNEIVNSGSAYSLHAVNVRDADRFLVRGNEIQGGPGGIHFQGSRGDVDQNRINGADGIGIWVDHYPASSSRKILTRNEIVGVAGDAIVLRGGGFSSCVLLYNRIENAGGDAISSGAYEEPRIHWNTISGSGDYDLRLSDWNLGAQVADARRNYWAATNAELQNYPAGASEIYDVLDDNRLGRVDYRDVEPFEIDTNVTLDSRFVWPTDGETVSRRTITLEGTAFAEAGIASVEVSTDGGQSWLPASGTDVWSYTYTPDPGGGGLESVIFRTRVIPLEGAGQDPVDQDEVTVTFDDSLPTTIGTLPANETWSGQIDLTGDVVVPAGTRLTIAPGTTVSSQPFADDLGAGSDAKRIELIVQGELVLQGASKDSILLTTSSTTPAKGHWYGIVYDAGERVHPELSGFTLEWAYRGISGTGSGDSLPDVRHARLRQLADDALVATNAPIPAGIWRFDDVDVSFVDSEGVRFSAASAQNADIEITSSTFEDVGSTEIYVSPVGGRALVADSEISSTNSSYGILFTGGGRGRVQSTSVTKPNGSGYGVYAQNLGELVVEDCELIGGNQTVYALRIDTVDVRRNRITDGRDGVYLQGSSSDRIEATIEANRISDTTEDGVYLGSYADATLLRNDLFNIGDYAVNNRSTNDILASDNYWGESTVSEMISKGCDANIEKIYDNRDSGSYGLVTYCTFAEAPFGDQPTIVFEIAGPNIEIRWKPKGELTYDLIRGDVGNLASSGNDTDLGPVSCEEQANGTGVIVDQSPAPAPGQSWFFLLRDHETPGTYGYGSDDGGRDPASGDCPLGGDGAAAE